MSYSPGQDVLLGFDVPEEEYEYLASLIDANIVANEERQRIIRESVMAGVDDFHYLIQCAKVLRDRSRPNRKSLDGQDVLSYIPVVLRHRAPVIPWAGTDRLIAVAKQLGEEARTGLHLLRPIMPTASPNEHDQVRQRQRRVKADHESHYWGPLTEDTADKPTLGWKLPSKSFTGSSGEPCLLSQLEQDSFPAPLPRPPTLTASQPRLSPSKRVTKSPYFHEIKSPASQKSPQRSRPGPGIVSSVPFPPLDAPQFGLVQERQAHEPFWLLVAVTFLIKTRGVVAVPVFEKFKLQFPSLGDIASPANAEAILDMIRPLGLSKNRLGFLQKYANGFLSMPPVAGRRYRVPGYDHREPDLLQGGIGAEKASNKGMLTPAPEQADSPDAWEIGHLTKGKYALDSWRIFCRDELLGRAGDWNGLGREGEFQPEWMRVRPDDKELRAYLRWMWMKEGWEWNPRTGEKTVLREELRRAVNEERVEYDDMGELRILDESG